MLQATGFMVVRTVVIDMRDQAHDMHIQQMEEGSSVYASGIHTNTAVFKTCMDCQVFKCHVCHHACAFLGFRSRL